MQTSVGWIAGCLAGLCVAVAGCQSCERQAGGAPRATAPTEQTPVPVVVDTIPWPAQAQAQAQGRDSAAGPAAPTARAAPVPPLGTLSDSRAETAASEAGHWAFPALHDGFSPHAALDLRYLNETIAGEHGFVRVDGAGDFRRGDGAPLRFWAVGTAGFGADVKAWTEHARWLAKRGVNMARWHGNLAPKSKRAPLEAPDRNALAELWAFVTGMKRAGIYTTASLYYPHATRQLSSWGFDSRGMTGLLFFEPRLQRAYRSWLKAALSETNPHTGIALKDDPALAIIQLQNEDSLLHWTAEGIAGKELAQLQARFFAFAKAKHGTVDRAYAHWHGKHLQDDAPGQGRLQLAPLWALTQKAARRGQTAGERARLADQTEFLVATMAGFSDKTIRFLREEVGARQLVNPGNWKPADQVTMMDAERLANNAGEVLAANRYVHGGAHLGDNAKWAVVAGDRFEDQSLLHQPIALPVALKQARGRAMIISESNWVPPMSHQAEGPFLVSAYLGLSGVDALYWFTHGAPHRQFRPPSSANGFLPSLGKWVAATPQIAGNYPAAALAHRNGYIKPGTPVLYERRTRRDLFRRTPPLLWEGASFDPNRDRGAGLQAGGRINKPGSSTPTIDPLAFLVGPVVTDHDGQPKGRSQSQALGPYLDDTRVRSNTGELEWDYRRGLVRLDAPCAQGVTGFFAGTPTIALSTVTFDIDNAYGAFWAVSLDTRPVGESRHVLLQAGTRAHPSGFSTAQDHIGEGSDRRAALRIVDHGHAPWQVESTRAVVTLRNPRLTQAVALDMNGMPMRTLALETTPQAVTLTMPPDAMYVVLRDGNPAGGSKPTVSHPLAQPAASAPPPP